jgi:NADH-quinone oxidoreductase subunit D
MLSGQRYHHGWIVPGGVRGEPPAEFWDGLSAWTAALAGRIDGFEDFFSDNALWVNRSELIGVLEPGFALSRGASGPVLRASGIGHDLRRDSPYAAYGQLSFDVPRGEYGDCLDRYRVRFLEMRESLKIIAQCQSALAGAGVGNDSPSAAAAAILSEGGPGPVPTHIPAGEAYVAVEGPRGELGLCVVSDGGPRPLRVRLRGPSLPHLHLLDELCAGHLLADLFVIYASLDIMVGEADR